MSDVLTVREHLHELKKRLIKISISAIIVFFISFLISEKIIIFLIRYFSLELFSLAPLEFIRTQLVVSIYLTLAFIIPFLLVQIYLYSKPIMKIQTKQKAIIYFFNSLMLAILGFIFGVFIFSKFSLDFFAALPTEVSAFWGVYSTIIFIIMSGFAFALTAQLIIIIPVLVKTGIVDVKTLKKSRAAVIVIALFVSAIVTSPDPLTQVLMGVPMYLCFETGILLSMLYKKQDQKD